MHNWNQILADVQTTVIGKYHKAIERETINALINKGLIVENSYDSYFDQITELLNKGYEIRNVHQTMSDGGFRWYLMWGQERISQIIEFKVNTI